MGFDPDPVRSSHINTPVIGGFEAVQSSGRHLGVTAAAAAVGDVIEEVVVAIQRDRRLLRRSAGADRDETVRDGSVAVLLQKMPSPSLHTCLPISSL